MILEISVIITVSSRQSKKSTYYSYTESFENRGDAEVEGTGAMEATAVKAIVEVFGAAAIVEGAELVFISIRYGGSLVYIVSKCTVTS